MMGMGPIIGALYDNFGPRWLILIGSLLHVFGIMMTSLASKYWQILLAQGVCSAIGVSAIFQPCEYLHIHMVPFISLTLYQL
jgi:predicted MFS family arabinose efflux permease